MGANPLSGSSMSPNRIRSIVLYTTTGMVLLFALVGLLFAVEQKRTQVETSPVLSSFSHQEFCVTDKRGSGRTIEIVIRDESAFAKAYSVVALFGFGGALVRGFCHHPFDLARIAC